MYSDEVMPMVYTAREEGLRTVYIAEDDAAQAGLVDGIEIVPVRSLGQLVEHLYGLNPIPAFVPKPVSLDGAGTLPDGITDFADVKGQHQVKRALEIAAGGNHNVRLVGPPGTGKTLLARALPGILPGLTYEEAFEVTRIYSVADMLESEHPLMTVRPFRAPHHTISQAGLIGGGSIPRPGEVTLAHRGVLFLDEATELSAHTLEVLRQPIEDKRVTISRAKGSLTFPANFLLVLAMNPCPCGYFGDPVKACTCTPSMILRYQSKLSGPLLDRIDIHVDVPRVEYDKLMSSGARRKLGGCPRAGGAGAGTSSRALQGVSGAVRQQRHDRRRDRPLLRAFAGSAAVGRAVGATDAVERPRLSSRAQAEPHDCRPRRQRPHRSAARRRSDSVSLQAVGAVTRIRLRLSPDQAFLPPGRISLAVDVTIAPKLFLISAVRQE